MQPQDKVQYLKVDFSAPRPAPNLVVGLGGSRSLAHLLALRQLTLPHHRFDGAIVLNDPAQAEYLRDYFGAQFTTLDHVRQFAQFLREQLFAISISGSILRAGMAWLTGLRQQLRASGFGKIKIKEFWK